MNHRRTSSEARSYWRGPFLAMCLLGASWSATAAPSPFSDCDAGIRDLQSLDVVMDELVVEIVDLMAAEEQTPSSGTEMEHSKVPFLFLTPRVATILEDVFGEDAAAGVAADVAEDRNVATQVRPEENASGSPVVENLETRFAAPESPVFENTEVLPRFQRHMYRTDI